MVGEHLARSNTTCPVGRQRSSSLKRHCDRHPLILFSQHTLTCKHSYLSLDTARLELRLHPVPECTVVQLVDMVRHFLILPYEVYLISLSSKFISFIATQTLSLICLTFALFSMIFFPANDSTCLCFFHYALNLLILLIKK